MILVIARNDECYDSSTYYEGVRLAQAHAEFREGKLNRHVQWSCEKRAENKNAYTCVKYTMYILLSNRISNILENMYIKLVGRF